MQFRGLSLPLPTYRHRRATALRVVAAAAGHPLPIVVLGKDDSLSLVRDGRQDPWFDWFTGCQEGDAALLLDPNGSESETLFLESGDPKRIIWDGPRLEPVPRVRKAFGLRAVAPRADLDRALSRAITRAGNRVALLWRTREPGMQTLQARRWRAKLRGVEVFNAEPALSPLRLVKDADEIRWHRRAVAITAAGLAVVLPRLPHLKREAQIASELTMHYRAVDNAPLAFPPIVGSGLNGATLHYPHNDRPLATGKPVLIDSGATAGGYCADVTRTVPQHGRFTNRRFREVYTLVLQANELACATARPGMTRDELAAIAWQPIIDAGFTRHHHLSHHIGLDVHDPADEKKPLQPGMIISNEPGIYLPDEGFGIRIEDDLLITRSGCEVLTRRIPKRIADLEALMG
jgi:Xaa-Pro aminopeptidase